MFPLTAETRADHLARMAEAELDVLVVGGGITGAGVALDAASRGLSVGLVERDDLASGTSGRSSRLIHGGARYLRHGDVGVVYESLRERRYLMRLAPHLVRPMPFVFPVRRLPARAALRAGLTMYDGLAAGRNIARHRRMTAAEVAQAAPGLARPTGGFRSWDCATDDVRLVVEVVRAAVRFGALVATRAAVRSFTGENRVRGAVVEDTLTGSSLQVRARVVVNATGVWASGVQAMARGRARRLRPSKGVHVVLERARLPVGATIVIPSAADDGRLVFVIPWGTRVIVGTTDTPYDGPLDDPIAEPDDIEVLLRSVDRAFEWSPSATDVTASWAGIRPLLDNGRGSTRDLSRRHVLFDEPAGLIGVTGGKLTAYRAMAEQVVDRACRSLGTGGPCRTTQIPLGLSRPLAGELSRAEEAGPRAGLSAEASRRLVERYGDDWEVALDRIRDDPALGAPIVDELPVLGVEVALAREREMALTDEDVLVRRTRLATMDGAAAAALTGRAPTPGR